MKTKKCRPVLVHSDEWQPLVFSTNKHGGLFKSEHYSPMKEMGDSYKQLVLISLEDEVKVGDRVYDEFRNCLWTKSKRIKCNGKIYKKVVATQEQLPSEYINIFIQQYNKGAVEDVEIEMEIKDVPLDNDLHCASDGGYYSKPTHYERICKPKLINGFVVIVEEEVSTGGVNDYHFDLFANTEKELITYTLQQISDTFKLEGIHYSVEFLE